MSAWPKDTTAEKNAFYGDFHGASWQVKFLTRITPPVAKTQCILSL